ncbi:hypothetical protein C8Q77DRAFT_1156348 [Trametes polyzona]|nr:hypothetical protein C8Q77DRAFT_1156348 [Trametes polyzona]
MRNKALETQDIGELTQVLKMPIDVFFEITSHLEPIDVLQLARASKELRAMLLSPAYQYAWIAARCNMEPPMPDCPPYMTETRYARLVFEPVCDACGDDMSVCVDYAIPARFCCPWWEHNVRDGGELAREFELVDSAQSDVFNLLPMANLFERNTEPLTTLDQSSDGIYYKPEFAFVAMRYGELMLSGEKVALDEFVEERKANALLRLNWNLTIAEWEGNKHHHERSLSMKVQQERIAAIEHRLREMGYERSEYPQEDSNFYHVLNQPRALTPKIWDTMHPKLVAILDAERQRLADEAFREKWQKRLAQFAAHYKAFLHKDREQKRFFPWFEDAAIYCRDVITGAEPEANVSQDEYVQFEVVVSANARAYYSRAISDLADLADMQAHGRTRRAARMTKKTEGSKYSHKGKGKEKAVAASDAGEAEADDIDAEDLAVLEPPNVVFTCQYYSSFHSYCPRYKTYHEQIEHWKDCHGTVAWSAQEGGIIRALNLKMELVKKLLDALGLPEDTTMTTVRDTMLQGKPECVCGEAVLTYQPSFPCTWYEMYSHVNGHGIRDASKPIKHQITFKTTGKEV